MIFFLELVSMASNRVRVRVRVSYALVVRCYCYFCNYQIFLSIKKAKLFFWYMSVK